MKQNTIGEYAQENVLKEDAVLAASDDPMEIITPSLDHMDGVGLVIVAEAYTRSLTVALTDHVVSGTHTWTFANGNFTANDVGATLTVAGAANANNNATVTIATVTNATTIVTGGTQTTETFNSGNVTAVVVDAFGTADITFEVSNNFARSITANLNQIPDNGDWADITAQFSPAPAQITATPANQFIQAYPLVARNGKLILTPDPADVGAISISVYYSAKGNE